MKADTAAHISVRVDKATKQRASKMLNEMGLSMSDAVRLLMTRIVEDRRLPFEVKVPNKETQAAIAELESGGGESFDSVDALMADLTADN